MHRNPEAMNTASNPLILVVEDDIKVAALLQDYIQADGMAAHIESNGAVAVDLVRSLSPSVMLLDLMLPGLDGIGVCKAVRAFSAIPIIMLTARVDEIDRLLGLNSGADDYVCKPFSPREVIARVKAQLRRNPGYELTYQKVWAVDEAGFRMSWRGHWLGLTPLEFRIFRTLVLRKGRVLSRAQLLDSLHEEFRNVSDRAVDSHVKNIRRKVQAVEPGIECITSVYGLGYRFDDVANPI
jgi:two-component system, OmpR family, response regulator BaeR